MEIMEEKFKKTFGIGFVIGYIFSLIFFMIIFMFCFLPRSRKHVLKKRNKMMDTPMMTSLEERRQKKRNEAIQEISKLENCITRLSFRMLYDATNRYNQANIIGIGKTGTMYKGKLPCECFIAIKRLNESLYLEKEFISKLLILSRLKHRNLVPFLGFAFESRDRFLICYKFMSNGKLYDWLHPSECGSSCLDWDSRAFIALKTAKVLTYLHNNYKFPVAHLNLSSKCILLDRNFEPKISNFGGAVLINKRSKKSFENVFKNDVYGFGMLLLELITGVDPIRNSRSFRSIKEKITHQHLTGSYSSSCSAVDKILMGQGFENEILHFLEVASDCLQKFPDLRPNMIQVYNKLSAFRRLDVKQQVSDYQCDTDIEIPRNYGTTRHVCS